MNCADQKQTAVFSDAASPLLDKDPACRGKVRAVTGGARVLSGLMLMSALSACSWLPPVPGMDRITGEEGIFRDRQGEYLQARTIPRTEIPAGMDGFIIDDLLVIPELAPDEVESFLEAPRPRPIEGRSDREVVIQRMEDRSWIVVDVSPGEVWPRIRDYWRQAGVEIAFENPTSGVMDTAWFVREGEVLNQDKFRVTVETGFQNNSSEIRIVQMSAPQATPVFDQVEWPATSASTDVEFETLNALSTYLADVADLYQASSVSFLAGNISSTGKATIVNDSADMEMLRLQADFQRSWAAVGRALVRAEVEVLSQDVGQGIYEVQYIPGTGEEAEEEEEEPGFLWKMVTLNGLFSKEETGESYPLRVQVQNSGSAVDVRISPSTTPEAPEVLEAEKALLRLIRNTIA